MSKRLDESWTNWSTPQNLGRYLNTPGNDFNYSVPASGTYAYFSSDFRGRGQSDLYRIELPKEAQPEPVTMITGRLFNAATNEFIDNKTHQLVIPKDKMPIIQGFAFVPNEIENEEEFIERLCFETGQIHIQDEGGIYIVWIPIPNCALASPLVAIVTIPSTKSVC